MRVAHLYVYLTGEKVSESFRRSYVQCLADRPGLVERLLGRENEYVKSLPLLRRMTDLVKSVGGDPYLHVLRGGIYLQDGRRDLAKAAYVKAIEEEETLLVGYWGLVTLSLQDKDYAETARLLEAVEALGVELADVTTVPEYAGFVQSDEYKEWMKRRGK